MGVINLLHEQDTLHELTYFRTMASVPFAGRYRLIDFALSNMVNSGVKDIAVLPSFKYRSLMDHLGTGKDWGLDRRNGGLFILPPSYYHQSDEEIGDLQNFYQHLDFFIRGRQKYVMVSGGNVVANIDYRPAFRFHQQMQADVTLLYKEEKNQVPFDQWKQIVTDENHRVVALDKQKGFYSEKKYLEVMIINKEVLLQLIDHCANFRRCNLLIDEIIDKIHHLNIFAFPLENDVAKIDTISSYYYHSLSLLQQNKWRELFYQPRFIYTKVKNDPPTKYQKNASVHHSFIANGCIIDGTVENSILFRGVKVDKGAFIKNSIVMQKSEIGNHAMIANAILDKRVKVSPLTKLQGEDMVPFVAAKRTIQ